MKSKKLYYFILLSLNNLHKNDNLHKNIKDYQLEIQKTYNDLSKNIQKSLNQMSNDETSCLIDDILSKKKEFACYQYRMEKTKHDMRNIKDKYDLIKVYNFKNIK